ncbi:MAG: sulfotransferase family 2 domain-containing protein [Kiritimatiellae bacterium]|nr:sulfotransferase family 2 domain-containing protein [Kiritimatiellia bacterium]
MYAFVHIPKTAGVNLRGTLRRSFGGQHLDIKVRKRDRDQRDHIIPAELKAARLVYPRLAGICGHRVLPFTGLERDVQNIRYFTFMREPVRRFMSHFNHIERGNQRPSTRDDLIRFCETPLWRNVQCRWLSGTEDAERAIQIIEEQIDFVGLVESFDQSLVMLDDWLGKGCLQPGYGRQNKATRRPAFSIDGDAELESMIADANKADSLVYDHVVKHVFPRQIERYGDSLEHDVTQWQTIAADTHSRESVWAKFKRNCIYKQCLRFRII